MPSAAYTAQSDAFGRQVQWLVEIDLDRCSLNYTTAPCTATDQGDGNRCFYSFPTCQDPANYDKTTVTYRFCLNDVRWPDDATKVFPLLDRIVDVPQKIDPKKLAVFPQKIKARFLLDYLPPNLDDDKTLSNTASVGEFWRNLIARNRNYPGRPFRVKQGFAPLDGTAFVLADFEQIGPDYKLKAIKQKGRFVEVEAESPLADLDKAKIPFAISQDNTIQDSGGINASVTTVTVLDAAEYPNPSDYTRNKVYVRMESEDCEVTARDTALNTLTIVRGSLNTTAASHATTVIPKHIVLLGTDNGTSIAPSGKEVTEVLQDLLEWADIAAADVNDTSFDQVRDGAWPDKDVLATLVEPKKVAEIARGLREPRGILMYNEPDGDFAATVTAPDIAFTALTEDNFVLDSVSVDEDEEARITRVALYYDPNVDTAKNPEDFDKKVVVINSDLEGANNFNGKKEDEPITDSHVDPGSSVSEVRNLARRLITRLRHGLRTFTFDLEIKNGTLNVGDHVTIETRLVLDTRGNKDPRPCIITARKQVKGSIIEYEAFDTAIGGRFLRIGPDTMTSTYDSATADEKAKYGYWGDATDNRVGTVNEPGYIFF